MMKKNTVYAITAGAMVATMVAVAGYVRIAHWDKLKTTGRTIDKLVYVGDRALPVVDECVDTLTGVNDTLQRQYDKMGPSVQAFVDNPESLVKAVDKTSEATTSGVYSLGDKLKGRLLNSKYGSKMDTNKVNGIAGKLTSALAGKVEEKAEEAKEVAPEKISDAYKKTGEGLVYTADKLEEIDGQIAVLSDKYSIVKGKLQDIVFEDVH